MSSGCPCSDLHVSTENNEDRAGIIADAAPNCGCELQSLSPYSPGVVENEETILRMVCFSMHVRRSGTGLLPTFFDHVFSKGMSAQRFESTSNENLADWINMFLGKIDKQAWIGYVLASCKTIREVLHGEKNLRAFCVYDAAFDGNPNHIEVCAASRLQDKDLPEMRAILTRAFSDILPRYALRDGIVQSMVNKEFIAREVPPKLRSYVVDAPNP